jgi:hypothetical protein
MKVFLDPSAKTFKATIWADALHDAIENSTTRGLSIAECERRHKRGDPAVMAECAVFDAVLEGMEASTRKICRRVKPDTDAYLFEDGSILGLTLTPDGGWSMEILGPSEATIALAEQLAH